MKGACIITSDGLFLENARSAFIDAGLTPKVAGNVVQMEVGDKLFTLYAPDKNRLEEVLPEMVDAVRLEQPELVLCYMVDCRSEELFCELVRLLIGFVGPFAIVDNKMRIILPEDINELDLSL